MSFGDFTPPDPDQVFQAIDRLKDAFAAAADNSKGASKPAFETLSEAFNNVVDVTTTLDLDGLMGGGSQPDFGALLKVVGAVRGFHGAMNTVQTLARTDADAAATFSELTAAVRAETQNLGGGLLGGLGGLGDIGDIFGKPAGGEQPEVDPPVAKPPRKKPEGPGGKKFKL